MLADFLLINCSGTSVATWRLPGARHCYVKLQRRSISKYQSRKYALKISSTFHPAELKNGAEDLFYDGLPTLEYNRQWMLE